MAKKKKVVDSEPVAFIPTVQSIVGLSKTAQKIINALRSERYTEHDIQTIILLMFRLNMPYKKITLDL